MKNSLVRNKRGLGGFIAMFVAFILIALILFFFVFLSGVVKIFSKAQGGLAVFSEKDLNIENVFSYMDDYVILSNARFDIAGGEDVNSALVKFEEAKNG